MDKLLQILLRNLPELQKWSLFLNGSSSDVGSDVGIVLESSEGHRLNCAIRFSFKATNNVAEYEALLADLRLAKEMQIKRLLVSSNS